MDLQSFIAKNKSKWERLRSLTNKLSPKNLSNLSIREIEEIVTLYRQTSSDLAWAQTYFPNTQIVKELNDLTAFAYSFVYSSEPMYFKKIFYFLAFGFPNLLFKNIHFIVISFALTAFFIFIGFFTESVDTRLKQAIVPPFILEHFKCELKKGNVQRKIALVERSSFSSFIMTNNIQVSLFAFATGIFFGIGSLYIIIFNGMMIGIIGRLFMENHNIVNYLAFILPHGVIEIMAIIISGAAGMRLGYSILNPAGKSRVKSLQEGAQNSFKMMMGVILMLIIAGLIEAYFTPILWIPDKIKIVVSSIIFLIMIIYFSIPILIKRLKNTLN